MDTVNELELIETEALLAELSRRFQACIWMGIREWDEAESRVMWRIVGRPFITVGLAGRALYLANQVTDEEAVDCGEI